MQRAPVSRSHFRHAQRMLGADPPSAPRHSRRPGTPQHTPVQQQLILGCRRNACLRSLSALPRSTAGPTGRPPHASHDEPQRGRKPRGVDLLSDQTSDQLPAQAAASSGRHPESSFEKSKTGRLPEILGRLSNIPGTLPKIARVLPQAVLGWLTARPA